MSWTAEEVKEAAVKVLEKAKQDEKFRERVLADVYAAVKEVTGKEIPREFKIQVVDGSGYHVNIVLPAFRKEGDELTDTELEVVAGGKASAEDVGKTLGKIAVAPYAEAYKQIRNLID
jgi:rRNA maturation endonuclease Nob1